MSDQVKKNMELVNSLMAQAGAKAGQAVQKGNKALIPVPVDYEADSGNVYQGTVFFRRPSSMDYLRMGAIKSELLRAFGVRPIIELLPNGRPHESMAHVDASVMYLARAISACDVLLAEPLPEWMQNHREIEDTDLIIQVYSDFDEALTSFRNGAQGAPARDGQAGAPTENVVDSEALRERDANGAGRDTSADGPEAQ